MRGSGHARERRGSAGQRRTRPWLRRLIGVNALSTSDGGAQHRALAGVAGIEHDGLRVARFCGFDVCHVESECRGKAKARFSAARQKRWAISASASTLRSPRAGPWRRDPCRHRSPAGRPGQADPGTDCCAHLGLQRDDLLSRIADSSRHAAGAPVGVSGMDAFVIAYRSPIPEPDLSEGRWQMAFVPVSRDPRSATTRPRQGFMEAHGRRVFAVAGGDRIGSWHATDRRSFARARSTSRRHFGLITRCADKFLLMFIR